jgi:hypothetical protein
MSKMRDFHTGGRKGQKMPKPDFQQVVAGPFLVETTDDSSPLTRFNDYTIVATSQTKIIPGKGPGKGPENVLWDIHVVNRKDISQRILVAEGFTYGEMRAQLLAKQFNALDRPWDPMVAIVTKEDRIFAYAQKNAMPRAPRHHILNRLQNITRAPRA